MATDSLDNVMTKSNKEVLVNVRLKPETRDEFRIAAELLGSTMSGLLHQFIVRTIREEKGRTPEAFADAGSNGQSQPKSKNNKEWDDAFIALEPVPDSVPMDPITTKKRRRK